MTGEDAVSANFMIHLFNCEKYAKKHSFKITRLLKRNYLAVMISLLAIQPAMARELQGILQVFGCRSLFIRSKANIAAAHSTTKVSKAGHYPVVSMVGTQVLAQDNK